MQDKIKKLFLESSLSRVLTHLQNHDSGFITAFRGEFTYGQNNLRNKALKSFFVSKGYGITKVKGSYIENYKTPEAREVGESTFFVVDLHDTGKLLAHLREQGELWEQDSILFSPKGSLEGVLWGTREGNDYPPLGEKLELGRVILGQDGEFMTKVGGRPFIFKSKNLEENLFRASGSMGRLGATKFYEKFLNELESSRSYASKVAYTQHLKEVFFDESLVENEDEREEVLNRIETDQWEEKNPKEFYQSINNTSRKEMLTDYSPSDFNKMELFKVPGIDAGFALKPMKNSNHKDIVAVHNNSGIKQIGEALMKAAIRNGGTHLDHFDGFLSGFYEKLGFIEYARDEYNPEYDKDGKLKAAYGEVPVIYRKLKGV